MKKLILSLFLLAIPALVVYPGTTGKIAGIVTDKATGDPIPGANIVILETSLGAASNLNGEYTILHVPPGIYSMQVSVIGYTKVVVNDVRVYIDETARIDVSLEEETIQVGEVVVVAERNLIKPDVATSVVSVSGEELKDLPIINVQDVLGMQAGIGTDGRDFFIRGGSGNQSLFIVDGTTMRDPRNNQAITKVALSTIKEISIERGGFNAEYGQVQAGIVNV
ncbi:MAG TPA: TonB-dependent receptor, partial [Ignavibacteriaceae bacterium]|nr:TonB-dependent receptor [Ignavibacteriaceae bacterium]